MEPWASRSGRVTENIRVPVRPHASSGGSWSLPHAPGVGTEAPEGPGIAQGPTIRPGPPLPPQAPGVNTVRDLNPPWAGKSRPTVTTQTSAHWVVTGSRDNSSHIKDSPEKSTGHACPQEGDHLQDSALGTGLGHRRTGLWGGPAAPPAHPGWPGPSVLSCPTLGFAGAG